MSALKLDGGRVLPGPVFLGPGERESLALRLRTLFDVLTQLPVCVFGGDQRGLEKALGLSRLQLEVVRRPPAGALLAFARSDLCRTGVDFRLPELNITNALGVTENVDINRAMLEYPATREFADRRRLGYTNTIVMLVKILRAAAEGESLVAMVDWPASFVRYEPRLWLLAVLLAEHGTEAVPCYIGQLFAGLNVGIELAGRRVDVVYRFFLLEEIVTGDDFNLVKPLLDAKERGEVALEHGVLSMPGFGMPLLPFDRMLSPLDPSECLGRWRDESQAHPVRSSGDRISWLVARYDDARRLPAGPRLSSNPATPGFLALVPDRLALPGYFLALDAPEYGVLRRMVSSWFTPRKVRRLLPWIGELASGLRENLVDSGHCQDLIEHYAVPLPSLVVREVFGVRAEGRVVFQCGAATIPDLTADAGQVVDAWHARACSLINLIDCKVRDCANDLFSELAVTMVPTGELSREQAAGMAALLLVAGNETTMSMISLGIIALLQQSGRPAALLAEPAAAFPVVEELVRYFTIMHFGLRRTALVDIRIGPVTVYAGKGDVLSLQGAHRDSRRFDAPDELNLGGKPRRNQALGFGSHVCILPVRSGPIAFPALPVEQALNELAGIGVRILENNLSTSLSSG